MPPTYSPLVAPSQTGDDRDPSAFGLREQNLRFILGLKLHNLRQERGLSLVQLSKGCGLSVSYLNEIEKGKKYPKSDKLLSLARALGVTYNELVSADPGEKLRPIAALLTTRMIDDLPLEHYGISPPVLMEIMAAGPDRLGALLAFFGRLATRFAFSVDDLLLAAVRDDLEAGNYHFPALEDRAVSLSTEIGWQAGHAPMLSQVRFSLQRDYGWEIDEQSLGRHPDLADVGAVPVLTGSKPRLFLHPNLPESRRAFFIAREIAATALGHYEKKRKQPNGEEHGFRHLRAAADASYLGGALLIPRKILAADLQALFAEEKWSNVRLLDLVSRHGGDAEVVFHRMAQVLPDLGIGKRYLTRTEGGVGSAEAAVNRELRLGGIPEIKGSELREYRSRRTVATTLVTEAQADPVEPRAGVGLERCPSSGHTYLVMVVAQARPLHPQLISGMALGIALDDTVRAKIRFLDDPAIAEQKLEESAASAATQMNAYHQRTTARRAALDAFLASLNG